MIKRLTNPWEHFALNVLPNENDSKECYWLREDESNVNRDSFTKHLCEKLAKDALQMANAHKHARTRESTTCLGVVLRDKDEHAKKLVFHNDPDKMNATMGKKGSGIKLCC